MYLIPHAIDKGVYWSRWSKVSIVHYVKWFMSICVHVVEQQLKSRVGMIVDSATATNTLNPLEQSECFYGNV